MPGIIESYIHTGKQIGVLVELRCQTKTTAMTLEFKTLATEIAMHIAASPDVEYIRTSDISDRVIRELEKQLTLEAESEAFKQCLRSISLYDQFYIRDNSITIEDLIKLSIAQLAEEITVRRFARFAIESDDGNPPDPNDGVPANPLPNSPTPWASEAETSEDV